MDLGAQRHRIEHEINDAIAKVLEHGKFIMGPEIAMLEDELCSFVGSRNCISCSSGTDAILMALLCYDVKPGDAIITTPFTFFATAEVISLLGATPVFVDIDESTFNINTDEIEATAAKVRREGKLNLRGLITVDLFGLPCDYDLILPIAEELDLFVIQDSAQAFGASYKGGRTPTQGHIGTTSFFPAKPLGCYGDGGAVFTDDDAIAEKLRSIRVHGKGADKYDNVRIGLNARLDTLQAAILLEKLKIYGEEIEARQRIATAYCAGLADSGVQIPIVPDGSSSVWAQFTIQTNFREKLQAALKAQGVPTAVYYTTPLHLLEAFADLGYRKGDFPVAEAMAQTVCSLPLHPYLEDGQIDAICKTVHEVNC